MKPGPEVKVFTPAIVKRTEEALAPYPEGQYNRLLPTETLLEHVANFQEPRIEILQFSANRDDGDTYIDSRLGPDKRLLSKNSLDKIAYAGGLSWYAPMCIVEERIPGKYIRCKATAVVKKANGEPLWITRTKEIDLAVEEEKIREGYRRKVDKREVKESEVEVLVRRDLLQLRENMLQLCESKACNRVIRAAFGLKSAYKKDEIEKPFVLVRFDTRFDLNDPAIQRMLAGRMQEAVGNMFGLPAPPDTGRMIAAPAEVSQAPETGAEDDLDDVLDREPEEEGSALTPEQEKMLRREARIRELVDGCDLDQLKTLCAKKLREREYTQENDPKGYVDRWIRGNKEKGNAQKKCRAEIIVDLEEEIAAGGEGK